MTEVFSPELGLQYETHPDVYVPSDDSLLFIEALRALPRGRLLEVGTGTGLVALAAAAQGHDVVATDHNPRALALVRSNAQRNGLRVQVVRADLLRGIRLGPFDAVLFNPPYLPTADDEHVPGPLDSAFDGGRSGLAVVERFVKQLGETEAIVLVVASSLQGPLGVETLAASQGFHAETVATRSLPHERLVVLRLARPATRKD